jgi:hypothetical protein
MKKVSGRFDNLQPNRVKIFSFPLQNWGPSHHDMVNPQLWLQKREGSFVQVFS